jgi:hypothetical protein
MAKVIVGMTISLDGFVADQSGSPERLYPDLAAPEGVQLEKLRVQDVGARTTLSFRVKNEDGEQAS